MNAAAALGAAALLPYTVLVAGRAPFDAKQGLAACLLEAQTDLRRSFAVVDRACRTDGGTLSAGAPQQTMVQDVQCEMSVKLFCAPKPAAPKGAAEYEVPPPPDSSSPKF